MAPLEIPGQDQVPRGLCLELISRLPTILKDQVLTMGVHLMIWEFLTEEAGSAAIEYGLLVAIFANFLIAALGMVGDGLISIFNAVAGDSEEVASCVQVGSNCKK